jgi:hypothetical protein
LLDGPVDAIGRVLRGLEARERELVQLVEKARLGAATGRHGAGYLRSLVRRDLDREGRLRLRSELRQSVAAVACLFVPRGIVRLAAVEAHLPGGAVGRWLLAHRPEHARPGGKRTPAASAAWPLADFTPSGLSDPHQVADLEALLRGISLTGFAG